MLTIKRSASIVVISIVELSHGFLRASLYANLGLKVEALRVFKMSDKRSGKLDQLKINSLSLVSNAERSEKSMIDST